MHYSRFNHGDYIAQNSHLPPIKHGVLLLLRCWYLANERAVPDAVAIDVGKAPEPTVRAVLEEFFEPRVHAGIKVWWNGNYEALVREFYAKSTKASKAGKLGGRPMKKRTLSEKSESRKLTTNQEPLTTNQEKSEKQGPADAGPARFALPDWLAPEAWQRWHAYRAVRKGWTADAKRLNLAKLSTLRDAGHDPGMVIDQSIERGWSGLFPLKHPGESDEHNPRGGRRSNSAVEQVVDAVRDAFGPGRRRGPD